MKALKLRVGGVIEHEHFDRYEIAKLLQQEGSLLDHNMYFAILNTAILNSFFNMTKSNIANQAALHNLAKYRSDDCLMY